MDARNKCYEGRVGNVRVLMENESLRHEVDQLIADAKQKVSPAGGSGVGAGVVSSKSLVLETSTSEQRTVEERTSQIIRQAEDLKGDIAKARRDIEARKVALVRRRGDLVSASDGIEQRRTRRLSDVGVATARARANWAGVSEDTANHRGFLCTEAAKLYSLSRIPLRGPQRYEYRIGKVEAISLSNLNALDPEVISTSLAHIAHILVLASRYLAIRLPAVVTLPHRDCPRPTILSLTLSYRHEDAPLSGSFGVVPGLGNSELDYPRDGRSQSASRPWHPRPRPLSLDKPIGVLAKEDPSAFGFFVEGVTLLAYDIAWACASQGIPVVMSENTSFEDMCHLGRNLWMLLLQNPSAPIPENPTRQNIPVRSLSQQAASSGGNGQTTDKVTTETNQKTERFSHGTAHAFLGSAEGHEFMRSFQLPAPMTLADELKKRLLSECVTDWEVVDDEAWAQDAATEPAVLVGARKARDGASGSDAKLRGVGREGNSSAAPGTRLPGTDDRNGSSSNAAGSGPGGVAGAIDLVVGARSRWTMLRGNRG